MTDRLAWRLALGVSLPAVVALPIAWATRDGTLALVVGGMLVVSLVATHLAVRGWSRDLRALNRRVLATMREQPQDLRLDRFDDLGDLSVALHDLVWGLRSKLERLSREHQTMATVLEYMADAAIVVDANSRVALLNAAAARLFQTTPEVARGHSFITVTRDHELNAVLRTSLVDGQACTALVQIGERTLRVLATPVPDAAALMVIQDISEMRRLERVRQEFIANISHELRTPLASVKLLTETLQDGALEDESVAHEFLDKIAIEVDHLTQLVRELLELSRIESGEIPLQCAAQPIERLISAAVTRLQPLAARQGIALSVELPEEPLPLVWVDGTRIPQVLINLLHNALKFTLAGGRVTVSAGYDPAERQVVVAVADTGRGIPADDVPRIFERFYKADRARASDGTGLGLAIAKHIVQAHQGRIWAESVEGRGATFCFALPVA